MSNKEYESGTIKEIETMNLKPVILAGGLGSRLRPYTYVVPKPLLPIGERPIIELTMYWLRSFGLSEVAIALGWRGDLIRAYLGDGSKYGLKIHYVQEEKRLGTIGPLAQLKDWIGREDVFMMNGDILTQLDLQSFFLHHKKSGGEMSVAVREHVTRSPFGVIDVLNSTVTAIREKPVHVDLISAGMYMISSCCIGLVPEDRPFDATELMTALMLVNKDTVSAYQFTEPWIAVEHAGDYQEASREWIAWANSLECRATQLAHTK